MYEDHPNHFYLSGLQIQLSPPRLPAPPPHSWLQNVPSEKSEKRWLY